MHPKAGAPGAIHIVLQNKGGVGKSFVASHLAQYFIDDGTPTKVFDSDPSTPTLSHYKGLQARYINFMDGDDLDVAQFDVLMTEIVDARDCVVVLDTGSSNFIDFISYVKSNHIFEVFREMDRRIVIHSVLTGGAGARETFGGYVKAVGDLGADDNIAWLNSFFGPVELEGKPFEDTKAFAGTQDRLTGLVRIRQRGGNNNVLHLKALREMTRRNLTYKEAIGSPDFTLWDKQRLRDSQREINEQLQSILKPEPELLPAAASADAK
jgi:hypothetical protein